jgi:uncharacterized protein
VALKDEIREALHAALKNQDKIRVAVIRSVLAEVKNSEIGAQRDADDVMVTEAISREVKRHRESIGMFRDGGREDLVAKEEEEMGVLMEFLPQQMGREDIVVEVQRVIEELDARGPRDKGRVMSQLMPHLRGRADGKEVSEVVSQLLS